MTECIHGLDSELCDICTPRPRADLPAASVATKPRTSPRKAVAPRLRDTPAPRPKVAPPAPTGPDIVHLRAHHWTHVSNLPAILADGSLRAGATPELDVSSEATRTARSLATVSTGGVVADHVPFALSPNASSWDSVRTGADGYEWSDAARATRANDYVVLVVPMVALGDAVVVTDGDAASPGSRSAAGLQAAGSLVRRVALTDPDLLEPEVLVPDAVDLAAVTLIGVPNDRARNRVKQLIQEAGGVSPRVAIYPPWFRPSED